MITEEGVRLGQHWDRIRSDKLDRYLVQEVEHPAYNAQSVLIRAFIIDRLFPREASEIIEAELFYSACASYALYAQREGWFPELYHTLRQGAPGCELPPFLEQAYREQFAAYFDLPELFDHLAISLSVGFDYFTSPFEEIWRDFLSDRKYERFKLAEFGCGSANDYRQWAACGVASLVEYAGMDVSSANISNALKRFPDERFIVGDICSMEFEDRAFDVTVAFDVYEHLSPMALISALSESLRVTRDECWMSFFNASDVPRHVFKEVEDYHWNVLSLWELQEFIKSQGFDVQIISVPEQLESRFEGYRHYNREAYIMIASRR